MLDRGHLRVRFTLITGDFLEASEFFIIRATGIEQHRYRYQWMDPSKTHLKRRWDNAPHFPEILSFPHHVHIDRENQVFPGVMMGIADLLVILEELLWGDRGDGGLP
ncbi:MAG: toxin-antitoxin system TumE family protein [Prochlorothrix sp.]